MSPIRIILADDHPIFLQGLTQLLADFPDLEVVATARSGLELLARLAAHPCEVVILDLRMPQLDGLQATYRIRQEYPAVKIIMLTVEDHPHIARQALYGGASAYLFKSSSLQEVHLAIRKAMQNELYIGEELRESLQEQWSETELSERELEILGLLARGHTSNEIAQQLKISIMTVNTHRRNILKKAGVKNTAELVRLALRYGLVD
ncbi:DNA-binding response regulator, NarL/FixJ family, contains REC and HTH domains [Catalinimonas alkaloidigena]|uniref:DNA-binding response regulator, NarL/FixJ family, contains REC and HTH domains n=1 Tax=Catalinimonas alkaloidigena TaxID=1075417 RepID=A0A1G9J4K8_9BACT|nr:response regulator transcription factor [Catalinimonas alkaloidigena]SDL32271.1 DNA-binding response regulator, NarL/FixJ family, contains REC and HTH domains [Catalinimonas alkaloidigena]